MQNPLGPYGNLVAALLAILVVSAAIVTHVVPALHSADPFLDNMALLAIGVVFGTQVVQNGTQAKATAALARVAALEQVVATGSARRASDAAAIASSSAVEGAVGPTSAAP